MTYQYDAMNRMEYVHEGGSNNLLAQYRWDALSRAQSVAYGDGTSDAYSQYDAGDNLNTLTQTYNGSNSSVTFNYTWLMNHQLNSAGVNNPLFQYVPQAGTVSYGAANADNGLTTMTASSGSATMTDDGNHNLTYDGSNTLNRDVENRLVQAENAAWGTSSYLYDPLGERKQKSVAGVATDFVLAGGEEIADYYETSATWRLTVRGADGLPLVTVIPAAGGGAGEEIVYVHHDMKGSTVALTEPGSSGPAESYTYSDYGQPQNGTWLAYQYAGYRYDSETGLYYMPARSYSPTLGRFLQADPSGFGGGFNLYAYAGNDPVNMSDPTGMSPDGGGYTVTLSESIPLVFGAFLGVPQVTVAAADQFNHNIVLVGMAPVLEHGSYEVTWIPYKLINGKLAAPLLPGGSPATNESTSVKVSLMESTGGGPFVYKGFHYGHGEDNISSANSGLTFDVNQHWYVNQERVELVMGMDSTTNKPFLTWELHVTRNGGAPQYSPVGGENED